MGKELALAEIRKNRAAIDALLMKADVCDQNIYKATKQMVVWGWEAGKYLCEVKELIPHGLFEQYIDEHPDLHFSARSARSYMQLYRNKDQLLEQFGSEVYAKSIESCLKLVAKPSKTAEPAVFKEDSEDTKSGKEPVDGTDICPRGGAHSYDDSGCCTKCCDQLPEAPADDEAGGRGDDSAVERASRLQDDAEAPAAPAESAAPAADPAGLHRGRGSRAGNDRGPDRRADLFTRGEQLYGELTRLLDELQNIDAYHDKEGIQWALSASYTHFRKWKRQ
jgi:hypothetical protein